MSKTPARNGYRTDLIQGIVDQLAAFLLRSVEVDTPTLHVIAASAQYGMIDERRASSILHRTPPLEPVPWLFAYGIQDATEPVRIPPNPEFGMLARLCVPLWWEGSLRGHVWIIDAPPLAPAELEHVVEACGQLAGLLVPQNAAGERVQMMEAAVADIAAGSAGALERARAAGLLPQAGAIHVSRIGLGAHADAEEVVERWAAAQRPGIVGRVDGELILVERGATDRSTLPAGSCVGTASAHDGVQDLFRRARFAHRVAKARGMPALHWDDLGAWRMLEGREFTAATVADISPEAAGLVRTVDDTVWRSVLAYLDNARAVEKTAKELFIHRATLHYRLDKARECMRPGVLDDGWEAAALHAGLQLHALLAAQFGTDPSRQVL